MHTTPARKIAWSAPPLPPVLPTVPAALDTQAGTNNSPPETLQDESLDTTLPDLLAAAECDMGCNWPEGPLSPSGCRW